MNRDKKAFNRKILLVFFLSLFILGTYLIFLTPSSVKVKYGLTVETRDKETISFNVFEPKNGEKKKPAIIIGHGIMVNKEMLKEYAIELAAAGFVAVPFDFRGHGQSSGELKQNLLINDVKAIKRYLDDRGDIDMNNLGYIGYSMGGGPGNKIVKDDDAFKCFIGIGTSLNIDHDDCVNRTLNILMILAKYDQGFDLKTSKKEIAERLDIDEDNVRVNKLYGSFKDGDATKLFLDDNSDHFLTAYDPDFIREARDWVINTFPNTDPVDQNYYGNLRALIIIMQVIGGIGFFFLILQPLCKWFLKPKSNTSEKKEALDNTIIEKNESIKHLSLKIILYSFLFAIPGILIMVPFFLFLPLSVAGFSLMLLFGQVFGLFILLWRNAKKNNKSLMETFKQPFIREGREIYKQVILGILLIAILFSIIYISVGLNYLGVLPSINPKLIWIPLYFFMSFLMFLIYGLSFQENFQSKLKTKTNYLFKSSIYTFGFLIIYFTGIILLLCLLLRGFFFIIFLYIAIPLFLLLGAISAILYYKTKNILTATIINALINTMIISTLSPFMLGLNMILIFAH
jgi:dienelactone hydrolase